MRDRAEVRHVLDDRDARREEPRVGGPGRVVDRVDVERVDPDERDPGADQQLDGVAAVRNGLSCR